GRSIAVVISVPSEKGPRERPTVFDGDIWSAGRYGRWDKALGVGQDQLGNDKMQWRGQHARCVRRPGAGRRRLAGTVPEFLWGPGTQRASPTGGPHARRLHGKHDHRDTAPRYASQHLLDRYRFSPGGLSLGIPKGLSPPQRLRSVRRKGDASLYTSERWTGGFVG